MEGKKNSGGGALSYKGEKKKKDLRKIKRFSCQQFGHYATKCPEQKKGSKKDLVATPPKIDEFSSLLTLRSSHLMVAWKEQWLPMYST